MIRLSSFLKNIIIVLAFFSVSKSSLQAQCVEIESLLVAACTQIPDTEGQNEMIRFKVGPNPLNTNNLSVEWPSSNFWGGTVLNPTKVSILNANIDAAGGCGNLLEPVNNILPANASVILVTSHLFDTNANSFGALSEDTYIIFHNSTQTAGYLTNNFGTNNIMRTVKIKFGNTCSDTVVYNKTLLSTNPGATVNFTPSGTPTYVNNGCSAPVQPFTVDAGPVSVSACAGETLNFTGTAVGHQSVQWSATQGTFSSANTLATSYTIPTTAVGTIAVILTATNSCGATVTDTITINVTASTTPTFSLPTVLCNGQSAPTLPTTSNNGITGTWSPSTISSTTSGSYEFTPNAGQCASPFTLNVTVSNGNITPTFTAINAICQGDTLAPLPTTSNNGITGTWTPALNNMATTTYTFTPNVGQCTSPTPTQLTITVNNGITPTFTAVNPICQGDTLAPLPTTSNNGITGTWAPALNNMATTTYTFTPNAGQCATTITLPITVNNKITPTFTAVSPICQGDTLAPLPTTSNNGITGTWTPALNNMATTTYTFTPNPGQCATTTTLTITVNNNITPTFTAVSPICQGETLAPLPTTSNNGITGTWAPALDNNATTTYTFTPNAGQCATTQTLTIVVNTAGASTPITGNNTVCMGDTLQLTNATPGGTWSSSNTAAATVDNNGIVTPVGPGFSTIKYTTPSICNTTTLDITVYLPPNPLLTDRYICVDKVTGNYISTVNMQCGVENLNHTFSWTLNGQSLATTTNLHVATEEGLYEVTVTNNITSCTTSASANVIKSSIAIAEATVAEDFGKNQTITVNVTGGSGNYLYQLDENWPQESNQFTVYQGVYTITVIDKNGCGIEKLTVFALNYPRYFTPNNDGYNDTWFIEGLSQQIDAQINIFDRYGKLVKSIKPYLNEYWDGTLNGYNLPSTDYWFTLEYTTKTGEKKEFRSHFSLKR